MLEATLVGNRTSELLSYYIWDRTWQKLSQRFWKTRNRSVIGHLQYLCLAEYVLRNSWPVHDKKKNLLLVVYVFILRSACVTVVIACSMLFMFILMTISYYVLALYLYYTCLWCRAATIHWPHDMMPIEIFS